MNETNHIQNYLVYSQLARTKLFYWDLKKIQVSFSTYSINL